MAEMLIDGAKLDACNTAEADAIRAKTGGTDPIPYDYANSKGFADAVSESGLFPGLNERMIRVGTMTGREDLVMKKIAEGYEEEVEDGISRLVSIIEPTLIAILAVVIGAILLTVMFPMIGILSNAV